MSSLRSIKNRWGRFATAALLLSSALAGCGGDQSATAIIENSPPPRQVRIATAVETKVARTVSATGRLQPKIK
jgi:multidrug efflux pump subunit AcrA (membrane-fusion protein)